MNHTIDLTRLVDPNAMYRCLTDYSAGQYARDLFDLDKLDFSTGPVEILTSSKTVKNITMITPPFLDGLFRKSLWCAGSLTAFLDRFVFASDDKLMVSKLRRGAAYSWLRTPDGTAERMESERQSLVIFRRAYPLCRHPWMQGYIDDRRQFIENEEKEARLLKSFYEFLVSQM